MNKILINSFPKGGTNLVAKLLDIAGYTQTNGSVSSSMILGRFSFIKQLINCSCRPENSVETGVDFPVFVKRSSILNKLSKINFGQYMSSHSCYSDHFQNIISSCDIKVIQIIRDPRDIAVSQAHYIPVTIHHPMYKHYSENLRSFEERLSFSIKGGANDKGLYMESIGQRSRRVSGWIAQKDCLTIRFEDLVGEQGGGDIGVQAKTIARILEFSGVKITNDLLIMCQSELFGGQGRTFRKGAIGSWKSAFNAIHTKEVENLAGWAIDEWGYT